MNPISVRGVVKRYDQITAVNGLNLEVPEGTCVGLLGPNGAGKSTTMRMLTGQTIADSGDIEVLGHVFPGDAKAARARMGVVPQNDNLDIALNCEQTLLIFTHLYRIPRKDRQAAIDRALGIANLLDRRDTRVDKLSGGMRRRLLIARALVHRPELVLMDEPTVGLDPQVRQELWGLIDTLRAEGTSILMSTHYIEEAERLADRVLIMSQGSSVAEGRPRELVRELVGTQVTEVYGPQAELARVERDAQAKGYKTRRTGTSIAVLGTESANGDSASARGLATGGPSGVLREGHARAANLEDVFVLLTGERID